jgi:dipeptidyl aminopeptidase/acylaminoacyl peptidase
MNASAWIVKAPPVMLYSRNFLERHEAGLVMLCKTGCFEIIRPDRGRHNQRLPSTVASALLVVVVAGLIATSGCESSTSTSQLAESTSSPTGGYVVEETFLGPLDGKMLSPAFSPDGHHFAYATQGDSKEWVVKDGQAGAEYDAILQGSLIFGPDSKRLAYAAKKGPKWLVVVDGREAGAEYDRILEGSPIFSPDGKRVAYLAQKGAKQLVVVDGHAGVEYDLILQAP